MIVIPMAGESRRFSEAGYTLPKFMLKAHGKSLFDHAVSSFSAYFAELPFLFILRDAQQAEDFVRGECERMGIADARVVVLSETTSGQAETVLLGLQVAGVAADTPITVFNVDTFRPGFRFSDEPDIRDADGYLEVFRGEGANWSYVRPDRHDSTRVVETAEKRPLSDLCCTGLYHFRRAGDFIRAYATPYVPTSPAEARERYIAPLYNVLIAEGADIRYQLIDRDQVVFCGVPDEYDAFLACGAPEN